MGMHRTPDKSATTVAIGSIAELNAFTSRRGFLRLLGVGGTLVVLPGLFTACQDASNTGGITAPGSGSTLTIDFSTGDTAVLQFALALEQLESDFYTQVVANFDSSTLTDADKAVLSDIRNHEELHRKFLEAALGTNGKFSLTQIYPGVSLTERVSVLTLAKTFEELGVAAYNGAAQYLSDAGNLLIAAKIVSVEARHASAIRDLLTPRSGDFAPNSFDDALSPAKAVVAAQEFIVDKLAFTNVPTTFVQGPNGNG